MKSKIKLLPDYLIDQIKAGEVVENPSLLLKEIIENSIDASATEIELTLVNNGLDLIRVKDNGTGMSFNDLPLAFSRHATSKLTKLNDLYQIDSYGFRGEALASIASISKITCQSKLRDYESENDQDLGGQIQLEEGVVKSHTNNLKYSNGVVLSIFDLFYNTPVRLNFLKSKSIQLKEIKKIINAYVLLNYNLKFSIEINNLDKKVYNISKSIEERILTFIKSNSDKNITEEKIVSGTLSYDKTECSCYLIAGNKNKKIRYVYINRRLIFDNSLINVVLNYYDEKLNIKYDGGFLINLIIDSNQLDVNIHPNKTSVKIQNKSIVYSLLTNLLKKLLPEDSNAISEINNEYNPDDYLDNYMSFLCEFIGTKNAIIKEKSVSEFPVIIDLEKVYNEIYNSIIDKNTNLEEVTLKVVIPLEETITESDRSLLDNIRIEIIEINNKYFVSSVPSILLYLNIEMTIPLLLDSIKYKNINMIEYNQVFNKIHLTSMLKQSFNEWLEKKCIIVVNNENIQKLF